MAVNMETWLSKIAELMEKVWMEETSDCISNVIRLEFLYSKFVCVMK
jgi:hypothetical protein